MEIELRSKVEHDVEAKICDLGAKKIKETQQSDEYFKFALDSERRLVIRIRKKGDGGAYLTFKGSSEHKDDIAWQEWESEIEDEEVLRKLLLSNGLETVVLIDKKRKTYTYEDFEINIDEIKGLGVFIEVELVSEKVEEAKKRIQNLMFHELKIPEENVITEGYVPLMIKKNQENA
ncbi:MAG: class IV adenylate cyclase [Candidatus Woesearchaeota archaeon]